MKKVLMVASVPSMLGQFNIGNLQLLQSMGYQVEVACNFNDRSVWTEDCVKKFQDQLQEMNISYYQIDFERNALRIKGHFKSYIQMKSLLKEKQYTFIHFHTPIAGAIGRLAAHKCKVRAVYTAHGFHFFKGAPLKNWLIFYPVERYFSRYTDVLITINKEDYRRAKKFHAKDVRYIPGVGVDTENFSYQHDGDDIRKEFGMDDSMKILLSVGELNENKNHEIIIRAMAKMQSKNICYMICGIGGREEYLKELARKSGVQDRVFLLGYRTDMKNIYAQADVFVFPSFREGLSVALMEAMASGLPVVCSDIRGNRDLVVPQKGGYLLQGNSEETYAQAMERILTEKENSRDMSEYNKNRIKRFDRKNVDMKMKQIYAHF